MSAIAFGIPVQFDKAHVEGITKLAAQDIKYAEQLGYRIKLLGITKRRAQRHRAARAPEPGAGQAPAGQRRRRDERGGGQRRRRRHHALLRQGRRQRADRQRGDRRPGRHHAPAHGRRGAPRAAPGLPPARHERPARSCRCAEVVTSYYLRLRVADEAGVLAKVTGLLANAGISIDAVLQREADEVGGEGSTQTDVIILTHDTREGTLDDAMAQLQALPTVLAPIVRLRKEELSVMRYLSTRGHPDRRAFCEILLEGLAPDGGLYLPEHYPQVDAATLAKWRELPYAELAFEILSLYIDDIPPADLKALCAKTYTAEVFGTRRDRAAARAGRRRLPRSPVQRPHARLQGHGDAAARQPVRVRTGPPRRRAEHPRRDQRRHRQRRRIRDARQEGRARLHDLARRPHEPVPAGADVQPAGRQHPQHRRSTACSTTARTS